MTALLPLLRHLITLNTSHVYRKLSSGIRSSMWDVVRPVPLPRGTLLSLCTPDKPSVRGGLQCSVETGLGPWEPVRPSLGSPLPFLPCSRCDSSVRKEPALGIAPFLLMTRCSSGSRTSLPDPLSGHSKLFCLHHDCSQPAPAASFPSVHPLLEHISSFVHPPLWRTQPRRS